MTSPSRAAQSVVCSVLPPASVQCSVVGSLREWSSATVTFTAPAPSGVGPDGAAETVVPLGSSSRIVSVVVAGAVSGWVSESVTISSASAIASSAIVSGTVAERAGGVIVTAWSRLP